MVEREKQKCTGIKLISEERGNHTKSEIDLFVFKWPPSKQPQGRCGALLCWDTETDDCLQQRCCCCLCCIPLIHLFVHFALKHPGKLPLGKRFFFSFLPLPLKELQRRCGMIRHPILRYHLLQSTFLFCSAQPVYLIPSHSLSLCSFLTTLS